MSHQVALLRGINVGGHNKIAMSELRSLFEALEFSAVKSLLQSGNVVFDSDRLKGAALENLLEVETTKRLGVSVDFLVRSAKELRAIRKEIFTSSTTIPSGEFCRSDQWFLIFPQYSCPILAYSTPPAICL